MMSQPLTPRIASTMIVSLFGMACCVGASAQDIFPCGDVFHNAYGPFDYRTALPEDLRRVESAHFTSDVENLRKGKSGRIEVDIDYTLRAFPNHPRALLAISKFSVRMKSKRPNTRWPVDCYFERAVTWRPDDSSVRLVYGIHLLNWGRKDAARIQLEFAEQKPLENGNFHYNLGLAFLELGDIDRAVTHARRAYALGYQLPGLKRKLEALGEWKDAE